MRVPGDETSSGSDAAHRLGPLAWALIAWCLGTVLGHEASGRLTWLAWVGIAGLLLGVGVWVKRRVRLRMLLCAAAVAFAAAGWWELRLGDDGVWGLDVSDESRLLRVEGEIEEQVFVRKQSVGELGDFDYRSPSTLFFLKATRVEGEAGWLPARARLIVEVPGFDGRLSSGDRVECTGWLAPLHPVSNAGERDRAADMRARGIVGRLTLKHPGHCRVIAAREGLRQRLSEQSRWALHHGLDESLRHSRRVAILDMLLLGERDAMGEDVYVSFRESGLAHALAISGLHLGILVVAFGWVLQVILGRPRWAALGALLAVVVYVAMIPDGASVWRAGLMSVAACSAMAMGRRISAVSAMCGAAILLLILHPWELFSAGFQLSFVVVAGLLLFVPRWVERWTADPFNQRTAMKGWLVRKGAEVAAVACVGWLVSLPLVAHHFGAIVPVGLVSGVLMLPVVTLALWLGYAKILVTLAWPWAGDVIGALLWPLGDAMIALAAGLADLPWATVYVPPPSVWWTLATLGVVGWFLSTPARAGCWRVLTCLVLCAAWLGLPVLQELPASRLPHRALRVNMFAVGDGSCYLLRSGGVNWVYDCGSSNYPDITTVTIAPGLLALGVAKVHTLVLSHPDADHFSGALELVERFGVRRVVTTESFLNDARLNPKSAAGVVIERLKRMNVDVQAVAAGWSSRFGRARVEAVWPAAGRVFERSNDASLVLRVEAAGRTLLLTGDVQQQAMTEILADEALRGRVAADVMELAHHGSMVEAAPPFLRAVNPRVVLQSTGPARLRNDLWAAHVPNLTRHVTAWHGMVELDFTREGRIVERRYRETDSIPIGPELEPGD